MKDVTVYPKNSDVVISMDISNGYISTVSVKQKGGEDWITMEHKDLIDALIRGVEESIMNEKI